ncbi:MAG: hypothetical protein P4L45_12950 [Ignavibacteriaceae bacterium]|nr:hypothetical protein [Ignavibacteriaceae bacterium]
MLNKIFFHSVLFYAGIFAQPLKDPQKILNQARQNFFIPDKGQWNPEVKYLTRIGGMNVWITSSYTLVSIGG